MMTTGKKSLAVAAVFVGAIAFGTAAAQTSTSTPPIGATSSASTSEQEGLAAQYVARMSAAKGRVRHLLDDARRHGRDLLKNTCLSDKLAQLEATSKSGEERLKSLQSAHASGDRDLANHHFDVLSVLRRRAEQLDAEANQCVGEDQIFPGEMKLTVSIDPNITPYDPTGQAGFGSQTGPGGIDPVVPSIPASPVR